MIKKAAAQNLRHVSHFERGVCPLTSYFQTTVRFHAFRWARGGCFAVTPHGTCESTPWCIRAWRVWGRSYSSKVLESMRAWRCCETHTGSAQWTLCMRQLSYLHPPGNSPEPAELAGTRRNLWTSQLSLNPPARLVTQVGQQLCRASTVRVTEPWSQVENRGLSKCSFLVWIYSMLCNSSQRHKNGEETDRAPCQT